MEDLIDDVAKTVRDLHYHLWQAILTINGFLIAALFTVISLKEIQNEVIKFLIWLVLPFLLLSCILVVWNFLNFRASYNIMYTQVFSKNLPSEAEKNKYLELFQRKHRAVEVAEVASLIILVVSVLIIIGITYTFI